MSFQLSNTKYLHERRSGTLLEWLSDVGGFADALFVLIGPFISYISALSFQISVTNGIPTAVSSESSELLAIPEKMSKKLYNRLKASQKHKLTKVDVVHLLNPLRKLEWLKVTIANHFLRLHTSRKQEIIQDLRKRQIEKFNK